MSPRRGTGRDVADVRVDLDRPVVDRVRDFVGQVGDPYRLRSGGLTVEVEYLGECTVEESVAHWLSGRR